MEAALHLLLLCWGLGSAGSFFIDTECPLTFTHSSRSFGYQVIQLQSGVIVSAPLHQEQDYQLYHCNPETRRCANIPITGCRDYVTASLGLSLAVEESRSQFLVCGPTLQRRCRGNIYVNGVCYQMNSSFQVLHTFPDPLPDCHVRSLNIVFLVDSSGSINDDDFTSMLQFVTSVMRAFNGSDTQFALVKFSQEIETEFDFKRFSEVRDPVELLRGTQKLHDDTGFTHTFKAMQQVLFEVFQSPVTRAEAEKVLIVITDGESYGDSTSVSETIRIATQLGVRRFAIGIGESFNTEDTFKELENIASPKPEDHILHVTNYSALLNFQKDLQDKIFTIEDSKSLIGSSFQMEMSQEGFSAILPPDGPILGAVGAYGWSGGAYDYRAGQQTGNWINSTRTQTDMKDSYLGYAVQYIGHSLVILGAPRYQHLGGVFIYRRDPYTSLWSQVADVMGDKIGSYFGSVLSGVPLNSSQFLLLVGAPTYYSPDVPGGQVYLCPINHVTNTFVSSETFVTFTCPRTLQGDKSQSIGHFGSAISILPDLMEDGFPELAVGAPYEDDNQGALYIFLGEPGGFQGTYSQRIAGRQVSADVMFFARSIDGRLDMTDDGLPDLVVGAEGQVLILRSRPVLEVSVSMLSFNPREILLCSYECTEQRRQENASTVSVCFTGHWMNRSVSGFGQLMYTLLLDAGRTNPRALFSNGLRTLDINTTLTNITVCGHHSFYLPECVEDSLSPLRVSLNYSFAGNAVLQDGAITSQYKEITFEKNCGGDQECQDDLRVHLTFAGLTELVVGLSLDVNVSVSVQNLGDDSYNTRVLIPFPDGLSYRRVSLVESNRRTTVSCSSQESQRLVTCGVNNPLLRPNTTVLFMVSFHVAPLASLGDNVTMMARVTSDNGGPHSDLMTSAPRLRVLYAIYVTIRSLEESSKYQNFSSSDTSIQHVYKVINLSERRVPLSVIFLVPTRLGDSPVWGQINVSSSQSHLSTCTVMAETPGARNYRQLMEEAPVLNCSVGTCLRTICNISDLEAQTSVTFTIRGHVTKDWTTEMPDLQKIHVQSSAEISFDSRTYHHILEESAPFVRAQVQTVLEMYPEYRYYPLITGGTAGGFVLLGLIAGALYKIGFFKRQYRELLENPGEESGRDEAPPTAPSE